MGDMAGKRTTGPLHGTQSETFDPSEGSESLRSEAGAAATAAVVHIRKVAATASAEAQLSVSAVLTIGAAALVSLLLVVAAWFCLIAAAVWFAASAGLPTEVGFLIGAGLNLGAVLFLFIRGRKLLADIGFSRTLKLVFPGSR